MSKVVALSASDATVVLSAVTAVVLNSRVVVSDKTLVAVFNAVVVPVDVAATEVVTASVGEDKAG